MGTSFKVGSVLLQNGYFLHIGVVFYYEMSPYKMDAVFLNLQNEYLFTKEVGFVWLGFFVLFFFTK